MCLGPLVWRQPGRTETAHHQMNSADGLLGRPELEPELKLGLGLRLEPWTRSVICLDLISSYYYYSSHTLLVYSVGLPLHR